MSVAIVREIPALYALAMKVIAKAPGKCISEDGFRRAIQIVSPEARDPLTQAILDAVIDAGRLTDDIFPVTCLDPLRTGLSLRNSKVSSGYIKRVVTQCPYLVHLDVSGCFQVNDELVEYIITTCENLQSLNLRNCRKLTDLSLQYVYQFASTRPGGLKLSSLQFGGNFNLTASGIENFVKQYPNMDRLSCLSLAGVSLTSSSMLSIARKCVNLQSVSFSFTEALEDTYREFIRIRGAGLSKLVISWLNSVGVFEQPSADFVLFLVRSCPLLTELDLTGLKNVNAAVLQQMIEFKSTQASYSTDWKPFSSVRAKFIGCAKSQVEFLVGIFAPNGIFIEA